MISDPDWQRRNFVSMDELGQQIDQHIPSTNLFYAIRIHGNFPGLTTRAIPKVVSTQSAAI
jgi:alpha-acetolactate decarboxylase